MAGSTEKSWGTLTMAGDERRLEPTRRTVLVVFAAVVNLLGWALGRLTLLDDLAYCAQISDGCETHMLGFPWLVALWISILIGATVVFGFVVGLSKLRILPAWFPSRLVMPLGVYFAVQGVVSAFIGPFVPIVLAPGYLLGPPLAVLFTQHPAADQSSVARRAKTN